MLKDFLGNEIHVGDKVFYSHTFGHGINRSVLTVSKMTEKSVGIKPKVYHDYEPTVQWIPAWKVVNVTSLVHEE